MKVLVINCGSSSLKYQLIDSDTEAGKLASNIMAFPTTILVDSNGKIIGETLLGGIDNQENYDKLMEQVQSVISTNSTTRE